MELPRQRMDLDQLRLAVEVMQDAVAVYDARADIVLVNKRLLDATGYRRDELVGQPVLVLMPESLREEMTPRMLAYAAAPVPRALEDGLTMRIQRKDGTTFDSQVANQPLHGSEGHVVVASIRNIRDVSLEEIKLRGMLEANPEATMICTPEGRMILSNTGAARLFGREHVSLFNQPVASLLLDDDVPLLEEQVRLCHEAALQDQTPPSTRALESVVVRPDGSTVPVDISITPLNTAQGLTLRVIMRDITERVRLQREAEAKKDGFLATVSHELRTPLTSVLGYGELLEDLGNADVSEHARSLLDVVIRNARRELRLVDDLLTMVQIGEGTFRIKPGQVNFSELVRNAVEAAVPVAQRTGVRVCIDNAGEDSFVHGDADRLGQAVDNLLTNSIKFSPSESLVAVALTADEDTAVFSVTNQGEGIGDTDVNRVFERLYRGDNAIAGAKQGVGLGLSIVRSIVEAHEGEVTADSTPTTTCFTIRLPRVSAGRVSVPGQRPALSVVRNGTKRAGSLLEP